MSVVFLHWFSQWQPFGNFPIHAPVDPDASVYGMALALSILSGLLFGSVPVRQVFRTDPYQVIKTGTNTEVRRPITARDLLLVVQIALCAVLITSSLVAVRGLVHAMHSDFGFEPRNSMLVSANVHLAGYDNAQMQQMQKRMQDTITVIPGVESVGFTDALLLNDQIRSTVFEDASTDLRPANAAAAVYRYHVSPDYLRAEGTMLLAGRAFTWHDDKNSPRVAIVNQEFARKMFGSVEKAIGSYYKIADGTRMQVVGIAENGKYSTLGEEPQMAMFLPILQFPSNADWMVVRSRRDSQQLAEAIRVALHQLNAGLAVVIETRLDEINGVLFPPQIATVTLGVMGTMGALLAITGIFGMAAYSVSKRLRELGIRVALGAQRKQVMQAALGHALRLLAFGSVAGLGLGILASRVLALIVYQANSRDPVVLVGVVLVMAMLGLAATWIPARRALSVDPMVLLREE